MMIPGMFQALPMARRGRSMSFREQRSSASPSLTNNFTSVDLGEADASRLLVVACNYWRFDTTAPFSSVTIAGVGASIYGPFFATSSGDYFYSLLAYARVADGATGTVTVAFNTRAPNDLSMGLFALYGVETTAPVLTGTDNVGLNYNLSQNVKAGDLVVGNGSYGISRTSSWNGLTERYDVTINTNRHYTAGDHTALSAESPRTMELNISGGYGVATLGVWR